MSEGTEKASVLFVCMGNICRSPLAEGIVRQRLAEHDPPLAVRVDSAGTHGYHVGSPPDRRARAAAKRRGIDIDAQRARAVAREDFARFDLILALDESNQSDLLRISPPECRERVYLLMEFAREGAPREVPDPYYGDEVGFERAMDLIEDATQGLIAELRRRIG